MYWLTLNNLAGSHTIDLSSAEDVEDDGDFQDQDDSDFSDVDSDDSDDLDDANEGLFEASAAIASQKECAIDALGDLFAEIKIGHFPYVEASTAALLANLKPHWHPGIRRASVCALLGFVATAHSIVGGPKWEKGDVAVSLARGLPVSHADNRSICRLPSTPMSPALPTPCSLPFSRSGRTRRKSQLSPSFESRVESY